MNPQNKNELASKERNTNGHRFFPKEGITLESSQIHNSEHLTKIQLITTMHARLINYYIDIKMNTYIA